jgi:lipopolysaccharide export system permease protein
MEGQNHQSAYGKSIDVVMKLLDQYILKRFLYSFLFILLMLTAIIALIDFTEKNGQFVKHKLEYKEILDYYYYGYVPFIINFITPISVFVTTVFVTSRLAQRTEIIAVMSSGVSFFRFLAPYLVGATAITLCSFVLTGWILAKANMKRVAFETEYITKFYYNNAQHLHIRMPPDRYFYVEHYRTYNQSGTNVTIETIRDNQLIEKLSAKSIQWLQEEEQWQLQDWIIRKIEGTEERIQYGSTLNVVLNIRPDDFNMNPNLHETLTLPELNTQIEALKSKGADNVHIFLTDKYVRYMSPFAAVVLTFMGVVVSARKTRKGIGLQLAVGFILAFVYIACFLFAKGFAEAKGTHILLTVWMPNIVFSILGIILYRIVPK